MTDKNAGLFDPAATCPGCGVPEGRLHGTDCEFEVCPVCGKQAVSCGCLQAQKTFRYTWTWTSDWQPARMAVGRYPFIRYSNVCARCGKLWPEMFKVEDTEWEQYIQPDIQNRMLCRRCFDYIVTITKAGKNS